MLFRMLVMPLSLSVLLYLVCTIILGFNDDAVGDM